MDAKLEKIENSEAHIEVQIDPETFEDGLQKAYHKVVKEVSVQGFRKGKVPREILEAHYGREILYQDALEHIVPNAFEDAVAKLEIEPIAQPEFEIDEIEGDSFNFKIKVAVKPEVTLGELDGLEVEVPEFEITEEDIERRVEEARSRYAQIVEKSPEEPAEQRDIVYIDFEGFVEGEAFAGGKGTDHALELGSNAFIPGFEEQLIGVKTGETIDVNVTFPEDYHSEELAGKDAVFKVTANKIQTRKKRELNNEWVQEVSQFETVEEYREDVKQSLLKIAETRKNEFVKQEIMHLALKRCEVPVADGAIHQQAKMMQQDFEERLGAQGLDMEKYYRITNSTEEEFNKSLWPQAEHIVKGNFMLEKIIEEKGIAISDEEIDKKIEDMAAAMGFESELLKKSVPDVVDRVSSNLLKEKAVQYLADNAVVKVVKKEEEKSDVNPAGENE
ncbi:MAG: trigger factor [Syntrophomonadaceae bacterium]|nr:trigger factor [Syntrophomonadaceae bacterium]MDD3889801.1 trigger factor [Syntrophomonadaceae bacterium]MDD4549564.1 trigger factor [Syntrophomonadaceae bacterium]